MSLTLNIQPFRLDLIYLVYLKTQ